MLSTYSTVVDVQLKAEFKIRVLRCACRTVSSGRYNAYSVALLMTFIDVLGLMPAVVNLDKFL